MKDELELISKQQDVLAGMILFLTMAVILLTVLVLMFVTTNIEYQRKIKEVLISVRS